MCKYVFGKLVFIKKKSVPVIFEPPCNIIIVNLQAPSEEKSDDSKDSFYEE
jgi:hypothetical protein